jgi:hypothetical protein
MDGTGGHQDKWNKQVHKFTYHVSSHMWTLGRKEYESKRTDY